MKTKPVNPAYVQRVMAARRRQAADLRAARNARPRSGDKAVRVSALQLQRASQTELASMGLARYGQGVEAPIVVARRFGPPRLFPGVVPVGRPPNPLPGESARLALDSAAVAPTYAWANQFCGLTGFPGYPYLAELALRTEFRSMAETTAKEMTRRWVKFKSASAGDKSATISAMDQTMREMKVRGLFRKATENDYYFGRYQIYMDIRGQDSDISRQRPLKITPQTLGKGCLLGLAGIEPMWTTPYSYNSIDPTAPDFYKPTSWFLLGKKTHSTRLLTFIGRPVPDLFKPAYNFSGISMSQLSEVYVQQWWRGRDAVADMLYNFSLSGIATNLATLLEEDDGKDSVTNRAQFFNEVKGNRGLMLLDKDTEEFFQFNTPLSGLAELRAQLLEALCMPSHIPPVKFTGVEPTGLNASSDGQIDVWYDWIHSLQQSDWDDQMETVNMLLQIHVTGNYDPDIVHEWVPMDEPQGTELAKIRNDDATAGGAYIDRGVISPDEERTRLQSDPSSGYSNLSGPAPGPPEDPGMEDGLPIGQVAENDKDRDAQAQQSDADRKLAEKTATAKKKKKAAK